MLDETLLKIQLESFYEAVRADALLGPIFEEEVADWDAHTERLVAFWSSIMLKSGRYKGNPFAAHTPFASSLTPQHFQHWLHLWSQTAKAVCPPAIAEQLDFKAQRIAASLEAGLLFRCDAASEHVEPLTQTGQ
ncbi:group III truncated hemoglobin [Devosia pacifica]|uniref:group III truncated hemoglobin n=1 Tax=Devosia pacifica TaxID=1335967 RepID=UPI001FCE85D0|nr:group III truncated hemoglobin [Devosia pacifica]